MALSNVALHDNANTSFMAAFQQFFAGASPMTMNAFTQIINAKSKNVELDFVLNTNTWREWLGGKQVGSPKAQKQSIPFRRFENSFSLDRSDVEYDVTGQVGAFIGAKVAGAADEFEKIVYDELISNSGAGPLACDGVSLFNTAHPMADGSTQSNKGTAALSFQAYDAVQTAGQSLRNHNGRPLGVVYDTLVCGPSNRRIALDIAGNGVRPISVRNTGLMNEQGDVGGTAQVGATAIGNVFQGEIKVVVSNQLIGSSAAYWYLMCTTRPDKPFILVQQRGPTPIYMNTAESEARYWTDKYHYSIEADVSPAAGIPFLSYANIL